VFSVYLLLRAIEDWSSEVLWASAAILLFAGCTARLAIMLLLPGATGLTLDAEGFAIARILRRDRFFWRGVSGFRVDVPDDERLPPRIVFNTSTAAPPRRGVKVTGALPSDYGLALADLAWLMTQWRERAVALPRPPSVPRVPIA
jgi:hypothetical protein